jgi:hypothetical protein
MSTVPSVSDNEQEISNSITRFIHNFKVGSLLKKCGCKKGTNKRRRAQIPGA